MIPWREEENSQAHKVQSDGRRMGWSTEQPRQAGIKTDRKAFMLQRAVYSAIALIVRKIERVITFNHKVHGYDKLYPFIIISNISLEAEQRAIPKGSSCKSACVQKDALFPKSYFVEPVRLMFRKGFRIY